MTRNKKNIVIIGATGSIGENTLAVIRAHPQQFNLLGIAANKNRDQLEKIASEFEVPEVSLFCEDGMDGIIRLSTLPEADIVVMASTGTICLRPTLEALNANKTVALASKEVLVLAGKWVMQKVREGKGKILPIDSEHNAIFQCMKAFPDPTSVEKIILTASGGPFRTHSIEAMNSITRNEALQHPNWEMGPKITVDSATMANKGLEMIEAMWLFNLKPEQVDVLVHPQSMIHSIVQGIDGSLIAQLGPPSMTFPIQNILSYPKRFKSNEKKLGVDDLATLNFEKPDEVKFPCLRLAKKAMRTGGIAPIIYNTANNVGVAAFLENQIHFLAIPQLIEHCLIHFKAQEPNSISEVIELEDKVQKYAQAQLATII